MIAVTFVAKEDNEPSLGALIIQNRTLLPLFYFEVQLRFFDDSDLLWCVCSVYI